jgi:malate synthase
VLIVNEIQVKQTPNASPYVDQILTPDALSFLAALVREFRPRVREILAQRAKVQERLDDGAEFGFLEQTKEIREADWKVAPLPQDLLDRRVEITGPVDRKMVINALNSGAKVFMADFEDSNAPTWENTLAGQVNLRDAVRRTIEFTNEKGKHYKLVEKPAVLMVRPRGWHLREEHILVDGEPAPASLVDFGLFFFHNAKELLARGSGPYFYLPKLESHLEARLWNDVFVAASDALEIPRGTIKATVLIETISAAFEMDEILWELREHSAGLNCGRWDYIFSFIKRFRNRPTAVMPDRAQVGMTQPFMKAYSELVIKTCHRRGVHAMGGMAAQIPIKNDPEANEAAMARVRADKEREVKAGHDGTWVAHPGLVPLAMEIFDRHMPAANQIERQRPDVNPSAEALVEIPEGTRTTDGLRLNIRVGIRYIEAWLRGQGCVPIYNLMEDAATAEISRTQVWQWLRHGAEIEGVVLDEALFENELKAQVALIHEEVGDSAYEQGRFPEAIALFRDLCLHQDFVEFLTLPAYEMLQD